LIDAPDSHKLTATFDPGTQLFPGESTVAEPTTPPTQQQSFPVDTSRLTTSYANFARVTGTPEELVLDFGLNTQMSPTPTEAVQLTHRLVVNFYTAKRLLGALHMALQQHEGVYGVVETDIMKRARNLPRPTT
jgi:hypothetical protein